MTYQDAAYWMAQAQKRQEECAKAEAERDEALEKLREQRKWSDQYRDCMWAEHDRADEALEKLAALVEIAESCRMLLEHFAMEDICPRETVAAVAYENARVIQKKLSNLPGAAKELLEERDQLREALDAFLAADADSFRDAGYPGHHTTEYVCIGCGTASKHEDGCPVPLAQAALSPAESD